MSRRDINRDKFPSEYEEEVLALLEAYGGFEDISALADYFGVTKKSIAIFLQTDRAKEAAARALPNAKKTLRPHTQLSPSAKNQTSLDVELEGCDVSQEALMKGSVITQDVYSTKKSDV